MFCVNNDGITDVQVELLEKLYNETADIIDESKKINRQRKGDCNYFNNLVRLYMNLIAGRCKIGENVFLIPDKQMRCMTISEVNQELSKGDRNMFLQLINIVFGYMKSFALLTPYSLLDCLSNFNFNHDYDHKLYRRSFRPNYYCSIETEYIRKYGHMLGDDDMVIQYIIDLSDAFLNPNDNDSEYESAGTYYEYVSFLENIISKYNFDLFVPAPIQYYRIEEPNKEFDYSYMSEKYVKSDIKPRSVMTAFLLSKKQPCSDYPTFEQISEVCQLTYKFKPDYDLYTQIIEEDRSICQLDFYPEEYKQGEFIVEGSYGKVYSGKLSRKGKKDHNLDTLKQAQYNSYHNHNLHTVKIQTDKLYKYINSNKVDTIDINSDIVIKTTEFTTQNIKEIAILKMLNHPNIITIYNAEIEKKDGIRTLKLYMEKAEVNVGSRLSELLPITVLGLFKKILLPIQYLHHRKICHLDLKLNNIMFTDKTYSTIKIIDFGMACFDFGQEKSYIICNYYYRPVEIYDFPSHYRGERNTVKIYDGFAIDIYCLGIILFELFYRKTMNYFSQLDEKEYKVKYIDHPDEYIQELTVAMLASIEKADPNFPKKILDRVVSLFQSMIDPDYTKRPTVDQILQSDLFFCI